MANIEEEMYKHLASKPPLHRGQEEFAPQRREPSEGQFNTSIALQTLTYGEMIELARYVANPADDPKETAARLDAWARQHQ